MHLDLYWQNHNIYSLIIKREHKTSLTRPELQQVMQDFDVFFEVKRAGELLGVDEHSVGVAGRLLALAEQHRAETHRQVLTRHLVHFLAGRYQLKMVKKLLQCHLVHTNNKHKRFLIRLVVSEP